MEILLAIRPPGERFTLSEIAAFCDVHPSSIWEIEQKALASMRNRFNAPLKALASAHPSGQTFVNPPTTRAAVAKPETARRLAHKASISTVFNDIPASSTF